MSPNQQSTFVLVPGSFVTPKEYDKVIAILESQGQNVKAIGLATVNDGSRMPPSTYEDDVQVIRSAILDILDNDKHDVILVMHSYSGIPGSSAVQGLSKKDRQGGTAVVGLVYIASFLPLLNESLRDIMWDHMPEQYRAGAPGDYLPAASIEMMPFVFSDVTDQDEIAKYHGFMERHASDSYNGKATYEAWKDIDGVQIIPTKDFIVPTAVQVEMYQRTVKQGGRVRKVIVEGGGHCPNVSQSELLVREMMKVKGLGSGAGSSQL